MAKKEKEAKTNSNKQKKHYFKDMKAELKKVIWPTPKQLASNTVAVIVFTLIIAVIVLVLDLCFDAVNKYGITAMQEKIKSSYSSESEESTSDESDSTEDDSSTTEESSEEDDSGSSVEVEAEYSSDADDTNTDSEDSESQE